MLRYKNTSIAVKTFYGVTFKPGEEKDVPGFINDVKMVRVASKQKEPPKAETKKAPAPVDVEEKSAESTAIKQSKQSSKEEK